MKNKRISKPLMASLLATSMIFPLAGCASKNKEAENIVYETSIEESLNEQNSEHKSKEKNTNETNTEKVSYLEDQYGNRESYKTVLALINYMENEDYQSILEMAKLPDNSIVKPDDVSYYLKRSDYSYLVGVKSEITEFNESGDTAIAKIKCGSEVANMTLTLNDNDEWIPQLDGLYKKDAKILAVGKAKVILNGIELDEAKNAEKYLEKNDGRVVYTLTIPNRPIKAVTETECFGTIEMDIEKSDKVDFTTMCDIDVIYADEALSAFKDIYNQMLSDAYNGIKDVASYEKYFSKEASADFIDTTVAGILSMAGSEEGIACTEVIKKPDASIFPVTTKRLAANIGYKLSFNNLGSQTYQSRFSHIFMDLEDGEYKLYSTGDPKLFSWINPYTKDY